MISCAPVLIGATWMVTHKSLSSLLTFHLLFSLIFLVVTPTFTTVLQYSHSTICATFSSTTDLNVFPLQLHFYLLCFLPSCSFRHTAAWDLCPPRCFTMHFLILGATSTFSCTKPLSFFCLDASLKHLYSPSPCNIFTSLHWNCYSDFVPVRLWLQTPCKKEDSCKFKVAQCRLYFPALTKCICCWNARLSSLWFTISYLTAFSDITGIQRSFPLNLGLMHKLQEKNNSFL